MLTTKTKPTRRILLTVGLALLVSASVATTATSQQEDDPVQFVRSLGQQAVGVLADRTLSAGDRERVLRELLFERFDMTSIGRLVMGRHWRRATTAQKDQFGALFEDYVVATYASRLDAYNGEQFNVGAARRANDKVTAVSGEVTRQQGAPIDVDWMIHRKNDRWYVIVEGVSMVISQRSEFSTIINQQGGIDGLIESIRTRIDIVSADPS